MKKPIKCVFCGKELGFGQRFINAWLGAWECHPRCPEGEAWRAENTIKAKGFVYLKSDWEKIKEREDAKPA